MKYTPFFLLLLVFTGSCKKDGLTKETQSGANTFSCLIDGDLYKPCSESVFGGPTVKPVWAGLSVSNDITRVSIVASCSKDPDWTISIEIANLVGTGEYSFSDRSNNAVFIVYGSNNGDYSSFNTGKGKVIVTKDDRATTILSGTFEFEGVDNDQPDKVVKVTSGRFDINYRF